MRELWSQTRALDYLDGVMETDQRWMQLALEQAARGLGRTHPNPMVGAVVVKNERLVSVGYHKAVGRAHAEPEALLRAGTRARGATLYVTLEPCNHFGRTPPCTDAIIAAGISRVVAGTTDPNPIVRGAGFRRLRAAGITVSIGACRRECLTWNEAYFTFMRTGRPFVAVKIAQSADGRVATKSGESQWITQPAARRAGHELRRWADAVVVGVGTVLKDNPTLNCRSCRGVDPIRVVLDGSARTPPIAHVVAIAHTSNAPTWIIARPDASPARVRALERAGACVLPLEASAQGFDVPGLLRVLAERDVVSVLVEGGPKTLGTFFDSGCIDKAVLYTAGVFLGGDSMVSVAGRGALILDSARRFRLAHYRAVGPDLETVYYPS